MTKPPDKITTVTKYIGLVTKLGLLMTGSIVGSFFLGLYIIEKFQLPKGLLILFVLIGVGTGFYLLFREVLKTLESKTLDD